LLNGILGERNLKVGLVTIGQSPRTDVTPTMKKMFGPEVKLIEKGALDGLTREEIDKFAPTAGDYTLVTRIRDGTSVRVAKRCIFPRVQKCIEELEEMSVDLTLLLCTGEFPKIKTKGLLIMPDVLVSNVVWGILKRGKPGVVVPEKEQIPLLKRKWKKKNVSLVITAASPYGKTKALKEAGNFLAKEDVDLIVLDCIGFTPEVKRLFRRLTGKPIILPQTILGRVLKELVSI
jgi:protein AroM